MLCVFSELLDLIIFAHSFVSLGSHLKPVKFQQRQKQKQQQKRRSNIKETNSCSGGGGR